MALSQVNFFSNSLQRIVTFHIYLPNDVQAEFKKQNPCYERETKTIYLLHGFSGNTTDWITGSNTMELSRKYNLAIVMPSGENSFYLNRKGTGNLYETYIAKELPEYIFKTYHLSNKPEDMIIGGLSMGGFGALRLGLKFNKQYGHIFGLSSAMIIHDIANINKNYKDNIADYDYYINVFGDLEKIEENDINPEYIIKRHKERGEIFPKIFMACGTEDFLIEHNREFYKFLIQQEMDVKYYESEGTHDWKFWNEYLEPAIIWAIEEKEY